MNSQETLLNKLPEHLIVEEIYKRIHKSCMKEVLRELISKVRDIACDKIIATGHLLQEIYQKKNYDMYYPLRYNILYYEAVEDGVFIDDHESCKKFALNWNESDDDHFSVFEDLPMLEDVEDLENLVDYFDDDYYYDYEDFEDPDEFDY
jgi:hypothetical protein